MNTIYVNGKGTDGLIHVAHPTERFKTVCGWEPPLDQRWYTQSSDTPTCPKCIAMTDTDTTQAVIEAARAVRELFSVVIVVNRKTGAEWLEVTELATGSARHIYSGDTRDDIYSRVAVLSGALEAHDDAMDESEDE